MIKKYIYIFSSLGTGYFKSNNISFHFAIKKVFKYSLTPITINIWCFFSESEKKEKGKEKRKKDYFENYSRNKLEIKLSLKRRKKEGKKKSIKHTIKIKKRGNLFIRAREIKSVDEHCRKIFSRSQPGWKFWTWRYNITHVRGCEKFSSLERVQAVAKYNYQATAVHQGQFIYEIRR